jgi:hypothetical protein
MSSCSRSTRGFIFHLRTTHEECGAGEDADIVFRTHRLMLLLPVNENKTLFEVHCASLLGTKEYCLVV